MADPTSGFLDNYNLRYNWGTGVLEMNTGGETWVTVPGYASVPGGAESTVQIKSGSNFGGATDWTWDEGTSRMFINQANIKYDPNVELHGLNIAAQIDDYIWLFTHSGYGIFMSDTQGQDNIGIGTNEPEFSAVVDITSQNSNAGVLFPRMTSAQRAAISDPAEGLMVYDTDLHKLCIFTTAWQAVTSVTI